MNNLYKITNYIDLSTFADAGLLLINYGPVGTKVAFVFHTYHILPNTIERNDVTLVVPSETLVLTITGPSTFATIANSVESPDDIVHYTYKNSAWGALEAVGSKGRITRRIRGTIDLAYDFYQGQRLWETDTSLYNGKTTDYLIGDTSFVTGSTYQGVGNTSETLLATGAGNYLDHFVIDLTKNIRNLTVRQWSDLSCPVFKGDVEDCYFDFITNTVFNKNVWKVKASASYFNVYVEDFTGNSDFGIMNHNMTFVKLFWTRVQNSGRMSNLNLFLDVLLHNQIITMTGGFTNVSMLAMKVSIADPFILYSKTPVLIHTNSINIDTIATKIEGFDLFITGSNGSNTTVDLTNQIGPLTYQDGVMSSFEYSVIASANIAIGAYSALCGIYRLTISGNAITVISTILGHVNQIGRKRVPLIIFPPVGEKIQIITNNADFGFLTNGKTYEADGAAVGEFIKVEWENNRYIVTAGRTI